MTTLFISDLHLCKDRPEIIELFRQFLKKRAKKCGALYILGDLFEVWLGDDAAQAEDRLVINSLHDVAESGIPIKFMHGNRDFLIDSGFENMSGCQIIPDPTRVELNGKPVLLMHGDTLCTDDIAYQEFRKKVRDPQFQQDFLSQTIEMRTKIADQYREMSRSELLKKSPEIMDVTQRTVEQTMRKHNVSLLIHGHTHRPAVHDFILDDQPAQRIVLGDWYHQGSVLILDENGFDLQTINHASGVTH